MTMIVPQPTVECKQFDLCALQEESCSALEKKNEKKEKMHHHHNCHSRSNGPLHLMQASSPLSDAKRGPSVSFSPCEVQGIVPNRLFFSDDDKENWWMTREEYRHAKNDVMAARWRLDRDEQNFSFVYLDYSSDLDDMDDDENIDCCLLGVVSTEGAADRLFCHGTAQRAVFVEQEIQWSNGYACSDSLSAVYMECAEDAHRKAYQAGLQLEAELHGIQI